MCVCVSLLLQKASFLKCLDRTNETFLPLKVSSHSRRNNNNNKNRPVTNACHYIPFKIGKS